jgi:hypothetical protein
VSSSFGLRPRPLDQDDLQAPLACTLRGQPRDQRPRGCLHVVSARSLNEGTYSAQHSDRGRILLPLSCHPRVVSCLWSRRSSVEDFEFATAYDVAVLNLCAHHPPIRVTRSLTPVCSLSSVGFSQKLKMGRFVEVI